MAIAILAIVALAVLLFESTAAVGQTVGQTMSGKLSATSISGYAQAAGFSGRDLVTAVAVALAESGGDPNAVGDLNLTPGGSVGLWQINLKAHPDLAGQDLTDPQINANAAYAVYAAAGKSFTPWSTYKTGVYAAHLDTANTAVVEA